MNLGAEAATTASQRLFSLTALFFLSAGCARVGTDNRGIDHPIFHIRIIGKMGQHPFPYTVITPASKPLVHTGPVPVFVGQEAPLCATAVNPQYRFHKTTAFVFVAHIGARVVA
jgi:hypothetical protein